MTMLAEKIVVTAKEFVSDKNINDTKEFNEPIFQSKLVEFDWSLQFAAACVFCEIVWKISIGRESLSEYRQLDRLFSPSPTSTYSNFRGCRRYKTGTKPEAGAIVVWRRGNSWQGHIAIVTEVAPDYRSFDIIEARALSGSNDCFLSVIEGKDKHTGLPFKEDRLNIMGFVYPPAREIA